MYRCRVAELQDVPYITNIYNQGIEDKIATLETRLRSDMEMQQWLQERNPRHKVVVIEDLDGQVHGWASLNIFNSRCCYEGVVDISVYIHRRKRGQGLGKILLNYLTEVATKEGFHKLVLSTFSTNEMGQRMYKSVGFREVGTYQRQGFLDGKWIDITVMEKLLT